MCNYKRSIIFSLVLFLQFSISISFAAAPQAETEKAAYYLKKATKHYNRKEYKKAEKSFRLLLKTKVKLHEDFYYFYGKVLAINGRYNKADDNVSMYLQYAGSQGQYYQQAKTVQKSARKKISFESLAKKLNKTPNSTSQKNNKKSKNSSLSNIPNMIKITPKPYLMGSNYGDTDQKPPHKVKLKKAFAVSQHEITFNQYRYFSQSTKRKIPDDSGFGKGNRPVIHVSFHDALDYCLWLSQKLGRNFRLPTEAEWEYFARTIQKTTLGFKDLIGLGDANCEDCLYFWEDKETKPVASYEANSYNLYDTFGNVWEWTCSAYTRKYNGAEKRCISLGNINGKTIAVRGASWKSSKKILKAYVRYNNFPTYHSNDLGFRIVEDL